MRYHEFKLDELTGVKKYHDLNAKQLMNQIALDYDLEVLGTGVFGTVIQTRNPEIVVKVFEDDDAYLSYLRFAQAHPNPYYVKARSLPRIMTAFYKRYDIQPDKFVVVELEKLYPLHEATAVFASQLCNSKLTDSPSYSPGGYYNDDNYTFLDYNEDYPWVVPLKEAADAIMANLPDAKPDMHAGNFMRRKDWSIVISDPVVGHSETAFTVRDRKRAREPENFKGPHYRKQHITTEN